MGIWKEADTERLGTIATAARVLQRAEEIVYYTHSRYPRNLVKLSLPISCSAPGAPVGALHWLAGRALNVAIRNYRHGKED